MKHPFKICQRKHCQRIAVATVEIKIPAKGHTLASSEPMTLAANNFPLCLDHYNSFNTGELLTETFKRRLNASCKQLGKMLPDYSRAKKEFVPIPEPKI